MEKGALEGSFFANIRGGRGADGRLVEWIRHTDTFFVSSADSHGRVDTSHRGGNAGFVRVEDGSLWIPDYPGNPMFATLGNFMVDPRGGLVFLDCSRNLQLQLAGDVRVELERGEQSSETGGTGRWWVGLSTESIDCLHHPAGTRLDAD